MRVAIDATPLIGIRTGIGVFLEGLWILLTSSEKKDAIEIAEYTLSFSARLRATRGHMGTATRCASSGYLENV